jgi:hypothetical protein
VEPVPLNSTRELSTLGLRGHLLTFTSELLHCSESENKRVSVSVQSPDRQHGVTLNTARCYFEAPYRLISHESVT